MSGRFFCLLFLVLLSIAQFNIATGCSSRFTNLDSVVNVDHSTNVGEVVYTLMNGNDVRSIEMDTSGSGSYGLNPVNDHEIIVTACVFWLGKEILRFKISGDSTWCGSLHFVPRPAIPQFTNPTEIVKKGTINFMETIDVVRITFANDQCAEFDCSSVTCTNDPVQNFAYFPYTKTIRIINTALQYGVTYTVEVTCNDRQPTGGTATQTLNIVFYETAASTATTTTTSTASTPLVTRTTPSTTTTTPTTTTTTPTTTTTTPTTTTTTPTTTTTTPSTTTTRTTTTTTTPTTTTTTPTTTTTTKTTTTTTPKTTTTTPSTTTTTPTTTTTTPTTTTTTPTTTTTTKTTTTTTPKTIVTTSTTTSTTPSSTTTTPTTTTTTPTTATTSPTTTTTTPRLTVSMPTSATTTLNITITTPICTTTTKASSATTFTHSSRTSPNITATGHTSTFTTSTTISDLAILRAAAIITGMTTSTICLLGFIVFLLYRKCSTREGRILPSTR